MIRTSAIQTAAYTITANAMSQLSAISNPAIREEALKFVIEMAEKHSATTKVVFNNINGFLERFKTQDQGSSRVWVAGAVAVGTIYAISKVLIPGDGGADPTKLVGEQKEILDEAARAAEQQRLAQEALRKGQGTQSDLTSLMQTEARKQGALIGQLGERAEGAAADTKAVLDEFKELLGEILGELKKIPGHEQRVELLEKDRTMLEAVKSQCAALKERILALAMETEEEERQLQQLEAQFGEIEEQIRNKG